MAKKKNIKKSAASLNGMDIPLEGAQTILDSFPEVMYVADPDSYEVLYANKMFREILGQDPTGKLCYKEFQGFEEPCDFCTNHIILETRKPYTWEFHNKKVDRHFMITDQIIKWADGRDVRYEIAVDISEKKKTELQLDQSRSEFRKIFDLSVDLICIADLNGYFMLLNPSWERVLGYSEEELKSAPFIEFIHEDDREKTLDIVKEQVEKGEKVMNFQNRYRRKNGEYIWLDWTSQPDQMTNTTFAIARDITEQKKVENDLKEHKEHLEKLVEQRTSELTRKTEEILELSTPVMQVWDNILVAPLIGTLDSQRTQQFTQRLLQRIIEADAEIALVDITGVPYVDTQTAQHIIETIAAVNLLGARMILTGVRPSIAQTLVHLGIDLTNVSTKPSLAAGFKEALALLNDKLAK